MDKLLFILPDPFFEVGHVEVHRNVARFLFPTDTSELGSVELPVRI